LHNITAQPRCGKCKAVIRVNLESQDQPLILTDQNFTDTVLRSPYPFLVDFHSPDCGPCKLLSPTVSRIARDYQGRLRVGTLDVSTNQYIPSLYRIGGTPILLLFRAGKEMGRLEGYQSSSTITQWLQPHAW
jgi:thioredoxin-like negative regulator of GroEL